MPPPTFSPTRALSPNARKRINRKLRDKKKEDAIDIPDRLRDSDASSPEDDAPSQGPPMFVNMNQSIFGLIAAAGSRVDFTERFDESSSSEEGSDKEPESDGESGEEELSKTTILERPSKQSKESSQRRKYPGRKLLHSLPTLPKLKSKARSAPERLPIQEEEEEEPAEESGPSGAQLARAMTDRLPVMSRMLEARAEVSNRPSLDIEREGTSAAGSTSDVTPLARRLMQIFDFEEPEQVVEEYPCWLLQSVLLQGFLYVTARHICFYAYLPKKANVVTKSGYLFKSGKHSPKYNRFWFRLKGDVLTYYRDANNLYFPHNHIDLTYGISASITDKDKEGSHFEVVTRHRTYKFRADSAPSANEWVKSLQRVIFRSHNDGDSVKISMPIANIIDIEDTQMMAFADTCKIRVIDNDETYAIDEYFFSFFNFGSEAITMLKALVEESARHRQNDATRRLDITGDEASGALPLQEALHVDTRPDTVSSEPVKATLPVMAPQISNLQSNLDQSQRPNDADRRRNVDMPDSRDQSPKRSFSSSRRSMSQDRRDNNKTPQQLASSESYVQSSLDDPSFSNIGDSSLEDPSASQILNNSEVFHQSPSRTQPPSSGRAGNGELRKDKDRVSRDTLPILNTQQPQSNQADDGASVSNPQAQPTTPTMQGITQMGSYPLQRAGAFADYLNKTRQRMSTLLATESMGYVEKVSGMWKGGRKHYNEPDGLRVDDDDLEEDADGKLQTSMERFRAHFALPESERLQATYFGYILRVLPLYGKIYISDRSFCFRSLLPGTRTKLVLPLQDIENVDKEKGFRFGYSGLVVIIKGHEELFFEFGQTELRDDCAITLLRGLEANQYLKDAEALRQEEEEAEEDEAVAERDALTSARQGEFPHHESRMPTHQRSMSIAPTILHDESDASMLNFKPEKSMNVTCLTIGSRGDVQPYIALCKGLLAEGHKPRIATHGEFKDWIESHGIEFRPVGGDPGELMRLCIEHGTFTWAFLREANSTFRGWLDDLLISAYTACEGSDLLIESPSAMAGIHIAEKLGIPYFRAFTMPWTRTRAYPHAFIMPTQKMGGAYNYMTYVMFDNIFWKAIAHQVNRWRNQTLGLPSTGLEKMQPNKVPFLYNFSPSVVAPPLDFSDWIRVTGYWFLDEGASDTYQPPKELADFIKKARDDGKKIVYVGFGSIIVNDVAKMSQEVIDAVLKADVRCILSKGWSDREAVDKKEDETRPKSEEPVMPPEIHVIQSAPHDWLFRQIDAAAHHGGSGTTGASLRAGIPTIIRPFFGDQFFFAGRLEDLGVGIWVKKWGTNAFGRALWEATRNERMIVKARVLGEEIRSENGVAAAIQSIYRDMEYSKALIQRKTGKTMDMDEEDEESWTFVGGDEPDPDQMTKKLSEGLAETILGQAGIAPGSVPIET